MDLKATRAPKHWRICARRCPDGVGDNDELRALRDKNAGYAQFNKRAMWRLVAKGMSLPGVDNRLVNPLGHSRTVRAFLEEPARRMLLGPSCIDWEAYQAIKPYPDPGWTTQIEHIRAGHADAPGQDADVCGPHMRRRLGSSR